jgi:hypothetical protein
MPQRVTGAPLFDPRQGPRDIPQESDIDLIEIISRMLEGEDEQAVTTRPPGLLGETASQASSGSGPEPRFSNAVPAATIPVDTGLDRGPTEIFGGPFTGVEEMAPPLLPDPVKPSTAPLPPVQSAPGQAPDVINRANFAEEERRQRGVPSQRELADAAAAAEVSPAPADTTLEAPQTSAPEVANRSGTAIPGLYDQTFGGGSGDILGTLLGYPGAISGDAMGPGKATGQDFIQQLMKNLIYSSTRSQRRGISPRQRGDQMRAEEGEGAPWNNPALMQMQR